MYKNVYAIGVFDLFHRGHVEFLKQAAFLGLRLIVAINGDEKVAGYKRKPYNSENDRLEIVRACKYVDEAFILNGYDNKEYIEKYQIDIIVHGNDWEIESYMKQLRVTKEYLQDRNVDVVLVPYTQGISTSGLISLIREDGPVNGNALKKTNGLTVGNIILDVTGTPSK